MSQGGDNKRDDSGRSDELDILIGLILVMIACAGIGFTIAYFLFAPTFVIP